MTLPVSLLLFGLNGAPPPSDAPMFGEVSASSGRVAPLILRYQADEGSLDRKYPIPLSATRTKRLAKFTSDWISALAAMPFEPLDTDERIDYVLFKNYLAHVKRKEELDARREAEVAPLLPFSSQIVALTEARLRMEPIDASGAAKQIDALYDAIKASQRSLESAPKPKPSVANRAADTLRRLQRALREWHTFYNGYDPLFTWWMETPFPKVDKAIDEYIVFLREKLVGFAAQDRNAIIGDPIRRDALLAELTYEQIPYTPEELVGIANREFAWCEVEMKKASQALGFGDDWHRALEHVKDLHAAPGQQANLVRELAEQSIAFCDKNDLVTIPPLARETWRMEMMSPERQLANPFFLGGEEIDVSFPTNTMTQSQKVMAMRGNNEHFSRATVFHELIPGHHLQGFYADRYRPYRAMFNTPFYVEGWALYMEMLLWDLGFARSPEDRVGMLFWRMHRCARIVLSLGFHLEQMTPQQCIDFLVERVGHERDNATAEVRRWFRGDYGPLYQAGYLLGGLQLHALHREIVDGKKMTNRQFHDAVLKQNTMPIEMVRAALLGTKLPPDFKPNWKFYRP